VTGRKILLANPATIVTAGSAPARGSGDVIDDGERRFLERHRRGRAGTSDLQVVKGQPRRPGRMTMVGVRHYRDGRSRVRGGDVHLRDG
jgi:hypothetical protein